MGEKQIIEGLQGLTRVLQSGLYVWNVLSLWCDRKISFRTLVMSVKSRPIAVAGRDGSYIVDPTFE
jgi:hypothetical protein